MDALSFSIDTSRTAAKEAERTLTFFSEIINQKGKKVPNEKQRRLDKLCDEFNQGAIGLKDFNKGAERILLDIVHSYKIL